MNVTLLGTASAEGLPGLFCRCSTCTRARAAGGRNIRTRSSALIDGTLKIDFPPDIFSQVLRSGVDLTAISSVLFTHGHDDHFCVSELQYRGRYFVASSQLPPLAIYGPRDVIERLKCGLDPELMSFSLYPVEPERTLDVGGYEVVPLRANHDCSRVCLNYILRGQDGAMLLYASDTGWYDEPTWRLLETFDLDGVVVECTQREEGGYPGHLSIPEVVRMRRRLLDAGVLRPGAQMVATHFGHQMGLLHEDLEIELGKHGVQAAYDGMVLNITPAASSAMKVRVTT